MLKTSSIRYRVTPLALAACAAALTMGASPAPQAQRPPLAVTLDRSEADAALAIIDAANAGAEPSPAQLAALYDSRPYKRLRERENSFARPFTDEAFLAYLRSPPVRAQAVGLRSILSGWTPSTIAAAAARARAYLPANATFRATIYPMIKIKPNTFVFDVKKDPSIFYALDPAEPPAKFSNTLAHELHHIGLGQNCPADERPAAPGLTALRQWAGAFGEGLAMLAAAGGPGVYPHAASAAQERALWDAETPKFGAYLREQDGFFRSVLAGTAGSRDEVDQKMFKYFGEAQGPWYSVGYRMAVTIEHNFGRPAVIHAFCHPAKLLQTYNRAAALESRRGRRKLPTWDPRLAKALAG